MKHTLWLFLTGLLLLPLVVQATDVEDMVGDPACRKKNIHSGNKVTTVFYNDGLVANVGEPSFRWPSGTQNEYVGDISILVGVEHYDEVNDTTVISVVHGDNPGHHPLDSDPENPAIFWGFEPLCGFANPDTNMVAMSHQPFTWPASWPDKGWPGSWNGFFGRDVLNADQESYFIMDDSRDHEFDEWIHAFPDNEDRGGLGIQVKVRGFQWSHVLAEDAIIWLYEITNVGEVNYDKVAFGMICGTLVGGRNDSRDDLSYFDIDNDFTYSWDADGVGQTGWVGEVGYVGYAFLESPGNPYDGIDNDNDSTDPLSPQLDFTTIQDMVAPRTLAQGDELVIIDYETYERSLVTLGADTLYVPYRDTLFAYYDGAVVQEDTLDLVDNNLNGLIDERFAYWDPALGQGLRYIDYYDYLNGGHRDPLIDERRDDGIDNDGDWVAATDDVGADGSPYTGDYGEGDGIPTVGEPHFEGTDITESDQIGLTSFDYFLTTEVALRNDQRLWTMLEPGHFDVIDAGDDGEDGDFIYGSGFFPLQAGETRFFSLAVLFGENYDDLLNNKITVQQIYDENYNFSKPPDKPQLSVVPGDEQVTLYWDNKAESSYDVVSGYDFEGYKIYRATDSGFNDVYTITDGYGNAQFSEPIAQFDLVNGNYGFFPHAINGVQFNLGTDNGLTHVWTDTTVNNGQRYFYAVTAYDMGDAEKNIYPAETSKFAFIDESGNISTDVNTAYVVPTEPAAGYVPPRLYPEAVQLDGFGTGSVELELIDPLSIRADDRYRIYFGDTTAQEIVDEDTTTLEAGWVSVRNLDQEAFSEVIDFTLPDPLPDSDTVYVHFLAWPGIQDSTFHLVRAGDDYEYLPGTDYQLNRETGHLYFLAQGGIEDGASMIATYRYDALYKYLYQVDANVTPVVDGIRLHIHDDWNMRVNVDESGWLDTTNHRPEWMFALVNLQQGFFSLTGQPFSADFRVDFYDDSVGQSLSGAMGAFSFQAHPRNFQVTDISRDEPVDVFLLWPDDRDTSDPRLLPGDVVVFAQEDTVTWDFWLRSNDTTAIVPGDGDQLYFILDKPFSEGDLFEYVSQEASQDNARARSELDNIRVVPNPYLVTATWESRPVVQGADSEKKIQFQGLPAQCTVRIYTVRGELVQTLYHHETVADGSLDWNLKSRDNLDVAYGIYVFHVDSSVGEYTGKFAIIR